jgi:hypothetical protein
VYIVGSFRFVQIPRVLSRFGYDLDACTPVPERVNLGQFLLDIARRGLNIACQDKRDEPGRAAQSPTFPAPVVFLDAPPGNAQGFDTQEADIPPSC